MSLTADTAEDVLQTIQTCVLSTASKCVPAKKSGCVSKNLQAWAPDIVRRIQFSMDTHKKLEDAKETHVGNDEIIQRLTEDCKRVNKDLRSHQRQEKARKRNKTFQDIMDANSCKQKKNSSTS